MSTYLDQKLVCDTSGFAGIAQVLRRAITLGELQPGEQFPPIAEMARRYRTTPITVRRALRELEEEGLVRVEHGVGTFVSDCTGQYDLLHLPSFSDEMAARDFPLETRVCSRESGVRFRDAALALGQEPETPLELLGRLRLVAGE